MKISILTICPEMFAGFLESHVIARAVELGRLEIRIVDIRLFADGCFRKVDDSPYGGGPGMIMRAAPVLDAVRSAAGPEELTVTAALSPAGDRYDQAMARSLAEAEHLILVCGRYEGIDERVYGHMDRVISIGDYVLSGGEIAAMAVADSVARLLPGVLRSESLREESFSEGLLEYPQYTRPADYNGEKVPEVLLSGDHEAIRKWRQEQALARTRLKRPDLFTESSQLC